MKKKIFKYSALFPPLLALSGCTGIDDKSVSLLSVYAATALLALLLLAAYCALVKKKDIWFLLLFVSVFIVNAGYLSLAISKSVEEALLANRISYFGSVFLPMAMLMIILNVTHLDYKKKLLPSVLLIIGTIVFFIAASPGYLSIYYKEVSLSAVNGVTVLEKVYGPWHCIYLFYLLAYFGVMSAVVIHAYFKKKMHSNAQAAVLVAAVFVNICVWLLGQLVNISFEFLSISYIISELFLLGLHLIIQEQQNAEQLSLLAAKADIPPQHGSISMQQRKPENIQQLSDKCKFLIASLPELTPTERLIYDYYIEGRSTRDIMGALGIKENTLKYHNKNLYGKLGVGSRKELLALVKELSLNEEQSEE